MKRLFLFTLAGLCISATAFAADSASISGRVLDPSGNPVARADIHLAQSTGAAFLFTGAAPDGAYSFAAVAPGDYLL